MATTSSTPQTPRRWQLSPARFETPTSTLILSSPTSAPKPSKANRERRPKLRASCDACAASKVKCSKTHPICQRCSANGSQCIYGVSRKHGKPGRTRKRNPDGTPFIKGSKQRPSPDGSEFGKFRVRPEPIALPLPDLGDVSAWNSSWSSTPRSLQSTPEFEFEMTPEPFDVTPEPFDVTLTPEPLYMDTCMSLGFPFMDDYLLPTTDFHMDTMQSLEPALCFRDPFAKKQSVQLDLPNIQELKDYIGGESINPFDCTFQDGGLGISLDGSSTSSEPSPKSTAFDQSDRRLSVSVAMPSSHCCSALAQSTLESLHITGPDRSQPWPNVEIKSLDSVLSTTRLAVQSVLQLLSCQCSSDPHLSMLYASITGKILSWYQMAAGVDPGAAPQGSAPSVSSATWSSVCSSVCSSPLLTPGPEHSRFSVQMQPLKFGLYEFDAAEQERLRRQVVLKELKKCGQLVEALANWRGDGQGEQAEFLYDVLGAWLRSELHRTLREVGDV
ncbi:uncharacterized protein M421DRAFT_422875 [Didymella exigua CBS 183.55]|uniref:Zn(2)-C6 fungal-type domain-containing protein n=1 Tax=Didymella exigua CBS 183.55 TaxID=1150837 RepID=A0A6A5RFY9_9PLEO|nr:uncharacterized protein M421DRAFT_422875 [Didymella exigua CBS 183.55]KAF1926200.1 hypothetical protein M421DRAFT_422875 [Didymella exigua CBS 183.55]